jgi:hypothetical protein
VVATTSQVRGSGLSFANAGEQADFTVAPKDKYGDARTSGDDALLAEIW